MAIRTYLSSEATRYSRVRKSQKQCRGDSIVYFTGTIQSIAYVFITCRFHHSSFFCGDAVEAAGQIVVKDGHLRELYPHSGHYRPRDKHLLFMIDFFKNHGVQFDFKVDAQRMLKISRTIEAGVKKKKVEAAHLVDVQTLYDMLQYRRSVFSSGLLDGIKTSMILSPARIDMAAVVENDENADMSITVDSDLASVQAVLFPVPASESPSGVNVAASCDFGDTAKCLPMSLTKPLSPQYDLSDGSGGVDRERTASYPLWLKTLVQDSPMPLDRVAKPSGCSLSQLTNAASYTDA
jgi:hypothetical protein